jgi:hypothetical protein
MAGVSSDRLTPCVAYVATHVSHMSRLMTLARPTGVGRALATYEIPIEGRDEWLAAARRLA